MMMPNPEGLPNPNGCKECGVDKRGHCRIWTEGIGWHNWVEPTDKMRLERMRGRRRRNEELVPNPQ